MAPEFRNSDIRHQRRAREFDRLPDRIIAMKKPIKATKLDRTRVLNANDLPAIAGGASALSPGVASEVMNNPLYVSAGVSHNPLY